MNLYTGWSGISVFINAINTCHISWYMRRTVSSGSTLSSIFSTMDESRSKTERIYWRNSMMKTPYAKCADSDRTGRAQNIRNCSPFIHCTAPNDSISGQWKPLSDRLIWAWIVVCVIKAIFWRCAEYGLRTDKFVAINVLTEMTKLLYGFHSSGYKSKLIAMETLWTILYSWFTGSHFKKYLQDEIWTHRQCYSMHIY